MRQIIRASLMGAALSCAALSASAQWYVGASAGQSRASGSGSQADQLADLGFFDASTRADDKDTMYRLHAGYRVHRNFAVELGFVDLGKYESHSTVSPPGFLDTSVKSHGIDLSAVGLLPLGERFTLFARAGAFASRTRASFSSGGSVRLIDGQQNQTKRSTHLVYGAGGTYDFTPNLGVRVEWARYDKLGDDFTGGEFAARALSAGVQWRF